MLRLEVFMAVAMKNAAFWDVTPCDFCKNQRFGGMQLLTLLMEKQRSSETSLLTRTTGPNISEDGILLTFELA
jgi:hypothetical protein